MFKIGNTRRMKLADGYGTSYIIFNIFKVTIVSKNNEIIKKITLMKKY